MEARGRRRVSLLRSTQLPDDLVLSAWRAGGVRGSCVWRAEGRVVLHHVVEVEVEVEVAFSSTASAPHTEPEGVCVHV